MIGLLAGRYDHANKCLYIQAAFPCTSTERSEDDGSTDVELDAEAEWNIRDRISKLDMQVVGWYHSHPRFRPDPSITDVTNQGLQQSLICNEVSGAEPFVGLIVSTYDTALPSSASRHQWFHVRPFSAGNSKRVIYLPMLLDVSYADLSSLPHLHAVKNTDDFMDLFDDLVGSQNPPKKEPSRTERSALTERNDKKSLKKTSEKTEISKLETPSNTIGTQVCDPKKSPSTEGRKVRLSLRNMKAGGVLPSSSATSQETADQPSAMEGIDEVISALESTEQKGKDSIVVAPAAGPPVLGGDGLCNDLCNMPQAPEGILSEKSIEAPDSFPMSKEGLPSINLENINIWRPLEERREAMELPDDDHSSTAENNTIPIDEECNGSSAKPVEEEACAAVPIDASTELDTANNSSHCSSSLDLGSDCRIGAYGLEAVPINNSWNVAAVGAESVLSFTESESSHASSAEGPSVAPLALPEVVAADEVIVEESSTKIENDPVEVRDWVSGPMSMEELPTRDKGNDNTWMPVEEVCGSHPAMEAMELSDNHISAAEDDSISSDSAKDGSPFTEDATIAEGPSANTIGEAVLGPCNPPSEDVNDSDAMEVRDGDSALISQEELPSMDDGRNNTTKPVEEGDDLHPVREAFGLCDHRSGLLADDIQEDQYSHYQAEEETIIPPHPEDNGEMSIVVLELDSCKKGALESSDSKVETISEMDSIGDQAIASLIDNAAMAIPMARNGCDDLAVSSMQRYLPVPAFCDSMVESMIQLVGKGLDAPLRSKRTKKAREIYDDSKYKKAKKNSHFAKVEMCAAENSLPDAPSPVYLSESKHAFSAAEGNTFRDNPAYMTRRSVNRRIAMKGEQMPQSEVPDEEEQSSNRPDDGHIECKDNDEKGQKGNAERRTQSRKALLRAKERKVTGNETRLKKRTFSPDKSSGLTPVDESDQKPFSRSLRGSRRMLNTRYIDYEEHHSPVRSRESASVVRKNKEEARSQNTTKARKHHCFQLA